MQEFIKIQRGHTVKREPETRIKDFKEIYELLNKENAIEQASRCIGCGNPFCHNACPLGNYIPFWLKQNASKNLELAFKLSNQSNPFPEITGRVCPQERLCEGACTLSDGHGAVMIGSIETFITEEGFRRGMSLPQAEQKSDKKVAIIGSGPASISAATYLLRAGVEVSMYESAKYAGGLLSYGIPGFKIQKETINRRIEILKSQGLKLFTQCQVGKDIEFESIINSNNAVFVGIGARKGKKAGIIGEESKGCFMALDFLTQIQKSLNNETEDTINLKDKKVVVIGGGDTAMDCLRSAIRLGAKQAICVYRRSKDQMGGSKKEFKNALEEGVEFVFNTMPKEIVSNEQNQTNAVACIKTTVTDNKVEAVKGSDFNISCDIVVFALGFSVSVPDFLLQNGVQVNEKGNIIINDKYETSTLGIYAGGDCVRGSDLVVTAAAQGKEAALSIIKALDL